jgi:hypothetical protein
MLSLAKGDIGGFYDDSPNELTDESFVFLRLNLFKDEN